MKNVIDTKNFVNLVTSCDEVNRLIGKEIFKGFSHIAKKRAYAALVAKHLSMGQQPRRMFACGLKPYEKAEIERDVRKQIDKKKDVIFACSWRNQHVKELYFTGTENTFQGAKNYMRKKMVKMITVFPLVERNLGCEINFHCISSNETTLCTVGLHVKEQYRFLYNYNCKKKHAYVSINFSVHEIKNCEVKDGKIWLEGKYLRFYYEDKEYKKEWVEK